MDWLTDYKIPVGRWASDFFVLLRDNFRGVFDSMSDAAEGLIDALLWILQTPHPLIIVAVFVGYVASHTIALDGIFPSRN